MKDRITFLMAVAVLSVAFCASTGSAANKKLAQTGFKFLSVSPDARAEAMGDAFTTVSAYSSSIFYNPANMARVDKVLDLSFSHNNWIVDMKHYAGSLAFRPFHGNYGVLGVSVLYVDYGEFQGTMVDPGSEKGFSDTGTFFPNAFSVGVGYAKALTDRFQVGGQAKYVSQNLWEGSVQNATGVQPFPFQGHRERVGVLAFDFGTIYHTGLKSLVFGMTVRNFSEEVKYQQEGFQLPLTFKMGLSVDVMDFLLEDGEDHSLLISVDAIHPRDYTEQINVGGEYVFRGMFALRAGYKHNYDEQGVTAGFGLQKGLGQLQFGLDYAYTPFGVFDQVQRVSARFSF